MAKFSSGQTGIRQIIRGSTGVNGSITIPPVTMQKAVVSYNGHSVSGTTTPAAARILLTSPTTLEVVNPGTLGVSYEIVEYY